MASQDTTVHVPTSSERGKHGPSSLYRGLTSLKVTGREESSVVSLPGKGKMEIGNFFLFLS